jgi:hypothetical protein
MEKNVPPTRFIINGLREISSINSWFFVRREHLVPKKNPAGFPFYGPFRSWFFVYGPKFYGAFGTVPKFYGKI